MVDLRKKAKLAPRLKFKLLDLDDLVNNTKVEKKRYEVTTDCPDCDGAGRPLQDLG